MEKRKRNNSTVSNKTVESEPTWRGFSFRSGLNEKEKRSFYQQMSILMFAGMDLKQSIDLMQSQQKNKRTSSFYQKISKGLQDGSYLWQLLDKTNQFSIYEISTIKIGEETGLIAEIFSQLRDFYNQKNQLKNLIVNALIYPVIVLFITLGTLYFMLTYVVPMFESIFKRFDQELPSLTLKVLALSNWIGNNKYYILLGVMLLILTHFLFKNKPKYKLATSNLVMHITFIKNYTVKAELAKISLSMHFMLNAGLSIDKAIELAENVASFYPMQLKLKEAKKDIINGKTLFNSIEDSNLFPIDFKSLIKVGEEVNELPDILYKISRSYKEELEMKTKIIGKIIEPMLIVLVAAIVGVVLIAMYLPMFSMSNIL